MAYLSSHALQCHDHSCMHVHVAYKGISSILPFLYLFNYSGVTSKQDTYDSKLTPHNILFLRVSFMHLGEKVTNSVICVAYLCQYHAQYIPNR